MCGKFRVSIINEANEIYSKKKKVTMVKAIPMCKGNNRQQEDLTDNATRGCM